MKWIKPSKISGIFTAPPSKSIMLRAVAAALLSSEKSHIINPSFCDDALAGLRIAEALGAHVEREDNSIKIKGGGQLQKAVLDCSESGLCIRMFAPIAALYKEEITLSGTGSLKTRPMAMMEKPLNNLGAYCKTNNGFSPILVKGPFRGGKVEIDGSISSQFLTGLLMALPLCRGDSELIVNNLKSKLYVAMTLSLLTQFGISIDNEKNLSRFFIKGNQCYKGATCHVEGDWSGASFLLVAGAISGKVSAQNLRICTLQADRSILDVLELINARISIIDDTISVEKNKLKPFEFNATNCPDLFPSLAVLACHCKGRSLIYGVERLKHKESSRAHALLTELVKIGAKITINGNRMEIEGSQLKGGVFDSHNDHRIAMAGAVAGLNSKNGVKINGWECASKSYPGFFEDLKAIGGDVT
jgi:3-phosphoshikimate 1-carboxyvinyltransferase